MWARVTEVFLGVWLLLTPFVFSGTAAVDGFVIRDRVIGGLVILLALLSLGRRFAYAHLATLAVAFGLAGAAYIGSPRPGPPAAQNEVVIALLLMMMAIVPSRATQPPQAWNPGD